MRLKTAVLLFFIGVSAFADVITLKDGKQITGVIESGDTREIHIKVGQNEQTIAVNQIKSVQFDSPSGPVLNELKRFDPIPPPPAPGVTATAQAVPVTSPAPPAPLAPRSFTLPAGTKVSIQTIDRIDSKEARKDLQREYAASIADPVVVNGQTILPAHAKAFLRVTDEGSDGMLRKPWITVSLVAVNISGQKINLEVGGLESKSGTNGKKDTAWVLVAAAGGAVVGGILFGKIGAAGGAFLVGTGAKMIQVARQKVVIGAEQRFTYQLTQPMVVNLPGGAA